MSDIAIRVENLSKLYHIGRPSTANLRFALRASLRDALAGFLLRILRLLLDRLGSGRSG
jgi:hypothetical protein